MIPFNPVRSTRKVSSIRDGGFRPCPRPPTLLSPWPAVLALLVVSATQPTGALAATLRWSSTSNRIYVEEGGTATLSDIKAALPNAPLDLIDPDAKIWLLRASLVVEDGSTLLLHGSAAGGDVDELRLLSRNSSDPGSIAIVDADWGTLDLRSVVVTSWDDATAGPDLETATYQRAFVRARSRQAATGIQESTLNVINSEIRHLGYDFREGYALTWQVVASVPGVRVFGTVTGSLIHHCDLCVTNWEVDDVDWSGNEIRDCRITGFKPSDPGHQAVLASNNVHDNVFVPSVRYVASNNRIYLTGPGTATLSDIRSQLPDAPLALVDPAAAVWWVGANLQLETGSVLLLHGTSLGGDVNELRLKSDNTALPNAVVWISADWGALDIRSTRITSWNTAANGPDTEHATYGRAYIRVRSSLAADGVTPQESRMDIHDSDIGYLGHSASEAYGLVWKVIGSHPDPSQSIFDHVEVYGDIRNSRLHHNYFGMYSYGHYGGQWVNNEVDHNVGYGFDPHDDSDHLLIEGNNVHHNGWHGIIASKRCDFLVIRNNWSWANAKNGIMLHRSCDDSVIEGNTAAQNGDAGIAVFGTWRTIIRNNLIVSNYNAGIRISVGGADHLVDGNEISHSGKNGGLFLYQGNDLPEPWDDGRPRRVLITGNYLHHLVAEAVKVQDSDDITLLGNIIDSPAALLRFQTSLNSLVASNDLPADAQTKISGSIDLPTIVRFIDVPQLVVNLKNEQAGARLEDEAGAIFDADEATATTLAASTTTGTGSAMDLSRPLIGTTTHVTRRPFLVHSAEVGLRVVPTMWSTDPASTKVWQIQTSSGTLPITFTVGDLLALHSHRLYKNGILAGTFVSDVDGILEFDSVPGATGVTGYQLVPD